jgi:hypothetical protein
MASLLVSCWPADHSISGTAGAGANLDLLFGEDCAIATGLHEYGDSVRFVLEGCSVQVGGELSGDDHELCGFSINAVVFRRTIFGLN